MGPQPPALCGGRSSADHTLGDSSLLLDITVQPQYFSWGHCNSFHKSTSLAQTFSTPP